MRSHEALLSDYEPPSSPPSLNPLVRPAISWGGGERCGVGGVGPLDSHEDRFGERGRVEGKSTKHTIAARSGSVLFNTHMMNHEHVACLFFQSNDLSTLQKEDLRKVRPFICW